MKYVTDRPSFQGDIMIRRVDTIPASAKKADPVDGVHILAHSETGHHHVIESRAAEKFIDNANSFIAWLKVADDAVIEHLRSFDTHESISLAPGLYEVRRQREYIMDGWQPAQD